jgi:hypothetical protein
MSTYIVTDEFKCRRFLDLRYLRTGICFYHRVHIFTRDETGLVCLPTQLERTLQLYW